MVGAGGWEGERPAHSLEDSWKEMSFWKDLLRVLFSAGSIGIASGRKTHNTDALHAKHRHIISQDDEYFERRGCAACFDP